MKQFVQWGITLAAFSLLSACVTNSDKQAYDSSTMKSEARTPTSVFGSPQSINAAQYANLFPKGIRNSKGPIQGTTPDGRECSMSFASGSSGVDFTMNERLPLSGHQVGLFLSPGETAQAQQTQSGFRVMNSHRGLDYVLETSSNENMFEATLNQSTFGSITCTVQLNAQ